MEKLTACPVCGGNRLNKELSCKDYVASGERFELVRCGDCSLLFTNPRPDFASIGTYYQSDRYVSHAGDKKDFSFIYRVYDWVRDYSIAGKLRIIKSYHTQGKLMDLGCGLGYFLDGVVQDGVFDAVGVDISDDAIRYVKDTFGYDVLPETELDTINEHTYDVITQWHVLEHVHLLSERMQQLKRILKPGGTLFIAVPNSASWDASYYDEFWDGYDVPRHLYHFNQKSFNQLMNRFGFTTVAVKPMLFDAPYISMRSEVHKQQSLPFVRGAIRGLISTWSAMRTGNHSSLLFIVKHTS